jgi:hypothetical protein
MTHRVVLFAVKVPSDAPTPEGAFELASLAGVSAAAPERKRKKRVRRMNLYVRRFGMETNAAPAIVDKYEEDGHTYLAREDGRIQVDDAELRGRVLVTPTAVLCTTLDWDMYVTREQADMIDRVDDTASDKYVVDLTDELADIFHNTRVEPLTQELFYEFAKDGTRRVPSFRVADVGEAPWPDSAAGAFCCRGGNIMLYCGRKYVLGKVWLTRDGALLCTESKFDLSEMTATQRAAAEAWREAAEKRRAATE